MKKFDGDAIVYIDLDGTAADFIKGCLKYNMTPAQYKLKPGAFIELEPMENAVKAINMIDSIFPVWFATKIPHDNPYSASEKLLWVEKWFPHLRKRVIITPDKGTLGNEDDYLIDDRPTKANCESFRGTFLHFGEEGKYKTWEQILAYFANAAD